MSYVILIRHSDEDPDAYEWERSTELPDVYPSRLSAIKAIADFINRADDEAFCYLPEDFSIVEQGEAQ